MAEPAKLLYARYILNVDRDYWLSLTGGEYPFDANSRGYNEAINKVANLFGLPSQLQPSNYSAYEKSLDAGIGGWLSERQYRPGDVRLYTEPKSNDTDKKYHVLAMILGL